MRSFSSRFARRMANELVGNPRKGRKQNGPGCLIIIAVILPIFGLGLFLAYSFFN